MTPEQAAALCAELATWRLRLVKLDVRGLGAPELHRVWRAMTDIELAASDAASRTYRALRRARMDGPG